MGANLQQDIRQSITLKENLFNTLNQRAENLGLSYPDYVRYLIVKDNEDQLKKDSKLGKDAEEALKKAIEDIKSGKVRKIEDIDDYVRSL
jgi:predicted DNA-binding protein